MQFRRRFKLICNTEDEDLTVSELKILFILVFVNPIYFQYAIHNSTI